MNILLVIPDIFPFDIVTFFPSVHNLETRELLFGKTIAVDYLDLFDHCTFSTLCSTWFTNKTIEPDKESTWLKG